MQVGLAASIPMISMVDDVEYLCLVREHRELKECFETHSTENIIVHRSN